MKTSRCVVLRLKTGARKNVYVGAAYDAKKPVDRSQFCDGKRSRSSQLFTQ